MAEAILLTEEIMNAVMDMVRVMVRITERLESSLYWTNHVSDVRPRPNEKPWFSINFFGGWEVLIFTFFYHSTYAFVLKDNFNS